MIDLGDVYRILATVRNPDGELANPTTATLTITLPDGTTTSPSVTLPPASTGKVTVDYPTVQAGRHQFVLATTAPQTAFRDVFDVRTPELRNIVSLKDAKTHLNISNDGSDEELRGFIESVTSIVEGYVGTLFPVEYTETVEANGATVPLQHFPVVEIVSITAVRSGTTVDPAGVDVDEYGVLRLTSGQCLNGLYRIVYNAGRAILPANWTRAALIILQHMWETQRPRDSRRPPTAMSEDGYGQDAAGRWYTVPRRAVELLQGDVNSGVA